MASSRGGAAVAPAGHGRHELDTGPVDDQRFQAWTQGRTGYPLVDAAMRQLRAEVWMPNRVRMVLASFLIKDLHIDWTRGPGGSCGTWSTATSPGTA